MNGKYNGGKETLSNKKTELIIIPMPKHNKRAGMMIKRDSKNNILFKDLFFDPIARIMRKSLTFSMIPPRW